MSLWSISILLKRQSPSQGCSFEEAIEQIDIGGPSMLRSAAKNHEDVLVVVDPADYSRVLEALQGGTVSLDLRRDLARKVFQHTARYDSLIANYLGEQANDSQDNKFPSLLSLQYEKVQNLRYGENPHQQGAVYWEIGGKSRRCLMPHNFMAKPCPITIISMQIRH